LPPDAQHDESISKDHRQPERGTNGRHGGHGLPNGSSNPAVFDPNLVYESNNKYWGDVIPGGDVEGFPYNGTNQIALNWTTAGKAVFFGTSYRDVSY